MTGMATTADHENRRAIDHEAVTVVSHRLTELGVPMPCLDLAHDLVRHLRQVDLLATPDSRNT